MLRIIALVLALSLLLVSPVFCQPLTLPPLPYAYDALEPVISTATMRSHHLAHHQSYTDKTNTILTQLRSNPATKHLSKLGLDYLITHIHNTSLPLSDSQRTQLRHQGGGYLNHIHYFDSLTAPQLDDSGGVVDVMPAEGSEVGVLIVSSFGSFEAFQQSFTSAALSVFGSGWSWLTYSPALQSLSIQSTQQQDSPWMEEAWVEAGGVVLLGVDVWEHAYYLDHQSKRAEYVRSWWQVVDWSRVEKRLLESEAALKAHGSHHELR